MKIAVFHYHLKPGGVTDVIVFSIRILLKRLKTISEIRLVTGEEQGTELVMERIRKDLEHQQADKVKLDVLPELAYTTEANPDDITHITRRIEARYGEDTLWWVHNYHLGKNPSFTAALMNIAKESKRDILLHIHDFPECGRTENLKKLNSILKTPAYPSGSRIRYAVINERDRKILAESGLEDSVTLLTNPLPIPPRSNNNSAMLQAALEQRCAKDNPGFIPNAPVLLYPVRCIRRKNVLEAAILTQLLPDPVNLVITLPGLSAQEQRYSNLVQEAYREGIIPGVWCPESTGDERLSYQNLASGSDAIISTSVQEGFGYLYLNSLYWKKPLLARYLDTLDGILDIFGDYPRRFWADLRIPADKDLAQRTQQAYLHKIDHLGSLTSERALKSIKSAAQKISNGREMDYSFLAVEDQIALLKQAKAGGDWLKETRSLNRELLDSISRTIMAHAPDMEPLLATRFSDYAYASTFSHIISSFGTKSPTPPPAKVYGAVSKTFTRIDYLRLLYDF